MRAGTLRAAIGAIAGAAMLMGAGAIVAPAASAGTTRHLFVSTSGTDSPTCGALSSPCRTIGMGVANAPAGGEVSVARGTYAESVAITKKLELEGHWATIDASGQINGINLSGGASGSRVHGFTVKNATGEGIRATAVDWIRIDHNVVTGNDLGGIPGSGVTTTYPLCAPQGEVPGDCGEGIQMDGTGHGRVDHNVSTNNSGGILITDDDAASHDNWITHNVVNDNKFDCGITMPSHSSHGVSHNVIEFNTANNNGGAGVLLAASAPGTHDDDNVVFGNRASGNGLGGVVLHAHAPGQTIDGNKIIGNWIGTNNTMGDSDAGDMQTTGILVFSAVVPVNGTVIRSNVISHDHFGIWLSPNVATGGLGHNAFFGVDVPVQQ